MLKVKEKGEFGVEKIEKREKISKRVEKNICAVKTREEILTVLRAYNPELMKKYPIKKNPIVILEVRLLLGIQYALMKDEDLLAQLVSSLQRQARTVQKEMIPHISTMIKILKLVSSGIDDTTKSKLDSLFVKLNKCERPLFCPTHYTNFEEKLKNLKK